jgi:hypothetical protein
MSDGEGLGMNKKNRVENERGSKEKRNAVDGKERGRGRKRGGG